MDVYQARRANGVVRYKRESGNPNAISWGALYQNLYGVEEMHETRLEALMDVYQARRANGEFLRMGGAARREKALEKRRTAELQQQAATTSKIQSQFPRDVEVK